MYYVFSSMKQIALYRIMKKWFLNEQFILGLYKIYGAIYHVIMNEHRKSKKKNYLGF